MRVTRPTRTREYTCVFQHAEIADARLSMVELGTVDSDRVT